MALLITGAMGHVGYETVKKAVEMGLPVIAQYRNTFREADAAAIGEGVTWVRCNLADPFEVATMAAVHDIDACIHTAATPNDKVAIPDPLDAFRNNVAAVEYLLETARRQSWRRFLLVSSGAAFQRWTDYDKPIPETAPASPVTIYGTTKHAGELLAATYAHHYGVSAATVRISWVYGPPLVPSGLELPRGPIPYYLRRALQGETIHDTEGGDYAAGFTYVTDVALGLLAAAKADSLKHTLYHLSSGENYSARQVLAAVAKAVPGGTMSVGPGTKPWTTLSVMRGPLGNDRMKQELGFTPTFSLEAGVADFANWMRANPDRWPA
jgi:nucleoside-diphosphate-sugar epimerase